MTVREVAAYLSFEDEFYFSGLFRRKIGTSPSRYRESAE
jgi:AraC-like DNA-binding protein